MQNADSATLTAGVASGLGGGAGVLVAWLFLSVAGFAAYGSVVIGTTVGGAVGAILGSMIGSKFFHRNSPS